MTIDREKLERVRGSLATVMNAIRPDWDVAGCVAALRALPPDLPLPQLGICAMRYCGDGANETPAMLADLNNRAWDSDWYLPCPKHPQTRARRTDGQCAACWADRHEGPSEITPRRGYGDAPAKAREVFAAARVAVGQEATK